MFHFEFMLLDEVVEESSKNEYKYLFTLYEYIKQLLFVSRTWFNSPYPPITKKHSSRIVILILGW